MAGKFSQLFRINFLRYFSPYVTLLILWVVTLFSQSMIFVIFRQQLTKRVRVMFITMVSMRIAAT